MLRLSCNNYFVECLKQLLIMVQLSDFGVFNKHVLLVFLIHSYYGE
jgi:hypothetical protein